MVTEFAIQRPTTQDSETILWKKFADWLYAYCGDQGASGLVEPNDGQNVTMALRSAAYNACSLAGLPEPTNQGQTQWIRSLAYSLYSLADNAPSSELLDPNKAICQSQWIKSMAYSMYSLAAGGSPLINPNNVQGQTRWVRSLSFSMYALATGTPPVSPPENIDPPEISNTSPEVGDTISVSNGTWTGSPTGYTYQWLRDGSVIVGETSNDYEVSEDDIECFLSCAVTASNAGGLSSPESSNSTDEIPDPDPLSGFAFTLLSHNGSAPLGTYENTGATTPAVDFGDIVKGWKDETSGSAIVATQSTTANAPSLITSNPPTIIPPDRCAIRFDGVTDVMLWPTGTFANLLQGAPGVTVYFAISSGAWTRSTFGNRLFVARCDGVNSLILINIRNDAGNEGKLQVGGKSRAADSFQSVTGTVLPKSGLIVVACVFDYANSRIDIYGSSTGGGSVSFGSTTLSPGTPSEEDSLGNLSDGTEPTGCNVTALLIAKTAHNSTKRAAVMAALSTLGGSANTSSLVMPSGRLDAVCDLGGGVLLAGGRGSVAAGRIFKSTDNGANWTLISAISSSDITSITAESSTVAYAMDAAFHVWKTTNSGGSWTDKGLVGTITAGPSGGSVKSYSILYVSGTSTLLVADTQATGHIWRSTNGATSWSDIGAVGTGSLYRLDQVGNGVVVNGWDGHVYKSTDDGQNWTDKGLLASPLYSTMYVGSGICLQASEDGHIFRSTDNGDNWTDLGVIEPYADDFGGDEGRRIYYSTYDGTKKIYYSDDDGATWTDGGVSPTAGGDSIEHMAYVPATDKVVAVTNFGFSLLFP